VLQGTWAGSAGEEELAKLSDGVNTVDLSDDTAQGCYFQFEAPKAGYVLALDEVRFFMNGLSDKAPFVGKLAFQGADGAGSWTDIWEMDASIHAGWNSKDFTQASRPPAHTAYRFQGETRGSCRVGEVQLRGIEMLNSDASEYSCTPKAVIDGVSTQLNTLTYAASRTPTLTAMSKRFGSVLGGETVEFTGSGFSSDAKTTVLIDGRPCAVTSQSTSKITCTTSDKPHVEDEPRLEIFIDGVGAVATQG
jgi:hypothetical protein